MTKKLGPEASEGLGLEVSTHHGGTPRAEGGERKSSLKAWSRKEVTKGPTEEPEEEGRPQHWSPEVTRTLRRATLGRNKASYVGSKKTGEELGIREQVRSLCAGALV